MQQQYLKHIRFLMKQKGTKETASTVIGSQDFYDHPKEFFCSMVDACPQAQGLWELLFIKVFIFEDFDKFQELVEDNITTNGSPQE